MNKGFIGDIITSCFPRAKQGSAHACGPESCPQPGGASSADSEAQAVCNMSKVAQVSASLVSLVSTGKSAATSLVSDRNAHARTQDDVAYSQHTTTGDPQPPAGPDAPQQAEFKGTSVSWLEMASVAAPTMHVVLTDEGAMLGSLGPLGSGLRAAWRPICTAAASCKGEPSSSAPQLQDAPMRTALAGLLGADVAAQALQACADGLVFRGPVHFAAAAHLTPEGNIHGPSMLPSEVMFAHPGGASNHQQACRPQDLCTMPVCSGQWFLECWKARNHKSCTAVRTPAEPPILVGCVCMFAEPLHMQLLFPIVQAKNKVQGVQRVEAPSRWPSSSSIRSNSSCSPCFPLAPALRTPSSPSHRGHPCSRRTAWGWMMLALATGATVAEWPAALLHLPGFPLEAALTSASLSACRQLPSSMRPVAGLGAQASLGQRDHRHLQAYEAKHPPARRT